MSGELPINLCVGPVKKKTFEMLLLGRIGKTIAAQKKRKQLNTAAKVISSEEYVNLIEMKEQKEKQNKRVRKMIEKLSLL